MKQKLLGTVALLAGLAMVQSIPAVAQNAGSKGAQSQSAPSQSQNEQGKAAQDAQPKANRAEPRSDSREKTTGQGREESQRGAAQNERQERREQGQRQEQRSPSQRGGQADEKSQAQDKPRDGQANEKSQAQDKRREGQANEKSQAQEKAGQAQQTPGDPDRGQAQSQPNQPGGDRDRMNQQGQRTPPSGEQPSQAARQSDGTVNLSAEQRTRIRTTVFAGNNVPRVNNVNFSIRVGTVVPRSVRIVEVPPTLIEIYPQWRGHSYFVVRDEIIIVDRDYHIVSVVPVGAGDAAQNDSRDNDRAVGASMTTEEIRRVQIILRERGFVVEVDGVLGPQTRQAIIAFQQKEGFQATGEIDERTSVALGVGRGQPGESSGDRNQGAQRPAGNQQGNQPTTGQGGERNTSPGEQGTNRTEPSPGRANPSVNNAPPSSPGQNNPPSDAGRSPAAR